MEVSTAPNAANDDSIAAQDISLIKAHLCKLIGKYSSSLDFKNACFWAEKLVAIDSSDENSRFLWISNLMQLGSYRSVAAIVSAREWHKTDPRQLLYAAKAFTLCGEPDDALALLKSPQTTVAANETGATTPNLSGDLVFTTWFKHLTGPEHNAIRASLHCLRAQLHQETRNSQSAILDVKACLELDPTNMTAIRIQQSLVPSSQQLVLADSRPAANSEQLFDQMFGYIQKLEQNSDETDESASREIDAPSRVVKLVEHSSDVIVAKAASCLRRCQYWKCLEPLQQLVHDDPLNEAALTLLIQTLVELNRPAQLFQLAVRLGKINSDLHISKFALGAYYYATGQQERARAQLGSPSVRDCAEVSLLIGHTFAKANEHDNAMAAYCWTAQTVPTSPLPHLYMGVQHALVADLSTSQQFMRRAMDLAPPDDPFVANQYGVLHFLLHNFKMAVSFFEKAERLLGMSHGAQMMTATVINNAAHAHRKLGQYDKAMQAHLRVLAIRPNDHNTFACIALLHALKGEYETSFRMCQTALSLNYQIVFVPDLIKRLAVLLRHETIVLIPTHSSKEDTENAIPSDGLRTTGTTPGKHQSQTLVPRGSTSSKFDTSPNRRPFTRSQAKSPSSSTHNNSQQMDDSNNGMNESQSMNDVTASSAEDNNSVIMASP